MRNFTDQRHRMMFRDLQIPKHTFVSFLLLVAFLLTACNMPTEATAVPPLVITPSATTETSEPTTEPTDEVGEPTATIAEPTAEPTSTATEAVPTDVPPTPVPPTDVPPTVTPLPTLTPLPEPTEVPLSAREPTTFDELEAWLQEARLSGMSHFEAHGLLNGWGWLAPEERASEFAFDFQAVDLSGDARPEWLVVVKVKDSAAFSSPRGEKYAGQMYVVADDAVVPFVEDETTISDGVSHRPQIIMVNDVTGDGIADALVEQLGCGANTCYGEYQFFTYHLGYLDDLASDTMEGKQNPHFEGRFNPETGEWRVELSVWNGFGLEGVRETEIYAWDGSELAYVETLTDVPDDAETLRGWLYGQWQSGADFDEIVGHLQTAGWLTNEEGVALSADFNNDGKAEWAFVISEQSAEPTLFGYPANVWAVNDEGVFSLSPDFSSDGTYSVQTMPDVTGNAQSELLAIQEMCGAHTCFQTYFIVAYHDGELDVLHPDHPSASVWPLQNSYSDWRVETVGDTPQFMIHGGTIGSIGAGIVRPWTDVWQFSPSDQKMHLVATLLDDTNWRHHLLYEANDLTHSGHAASIDAGIALYERVITDDSLNNYSHGGDENAARADMNQYAAFRLIYTWLRPPMMDNANHWLTYLQTNYPDTPITLAAVAMVDEYNTSTSLDAACGAAQTVVASYDNPTGELRDMGYGNPSLDADSICS